MPEMQNCLLGQETMRQIQLTQGRVALVDDADYEWLNQWKWCVSKNRATFYAVRGIYLTKNKTILIFMHREILGLRRSDRRQCDHIDHNGLNNQRSNLRICTNQQNHFNQRFNNNSSSKFKGVCWHKKANRWMAYIGYKNKNINLGCFSKEIDAAKAYNKAAIEYFGEFARLNEFF